MEKVPILWEKYEDQFPTSSRYDGFCCIFLYYWKLIEKSMHFPFDEVYHRMGIVWGKITHIMGKVRLPISQVHPVRWILLHFPELWEIDGETLAYPIWKSNGKSAPILWVKYEHQFPRLSPYNGFCCIFPYRGKFMGKPMHFPYDAIG